MNYQPDSDIASPLMSQDHEQINLRDYVQVMWRRIWVIILVFLVVFGAVLVWTLMMRPVYQARATLDAAG